MQISWALTTKRMKRERSLRRAAGKGTQGKQKSKRIAHILAAFYKRPTKNTESRKDQRIYNVNLSYCWIFRICQMINKESWYIVNRLYSTEIETQLWFENLTIRQGLSYTWREILWLIINIFISNTESLLVKLTRCP